MRWNPLTGMFVITTMLAISTYLVFLVGPPIHPKPADIDAKSMPDDIERQRSDAKGIPFVVSHSSNFDSSLHLTCQNRGYDCIG